MKHLVRKLQVSIPRVVAAPRHACDFDPHSLVVDGGVQAFRVNSFHRSGIANSATGGLFHDKSMGLLFEELAYRRSMTPAQAERRPFKFLKLKKAAGQAAGSHGRRH